MVIRYGSRLRMHAEAWKLYNQLHYDRLPVTVCIVTKLSNFSETESIKDQSN